MPTFLLREFIDLLLPYVTAMSKMMARAVAIRRNDHLTASDLLPRFQSANRKRHSTETAMLRVWSDILTAADQRHVTLLGLLDMSAAFDCVDHDLLVQRLQLGFSLTGAVLEWICSFLQGRTQQVLYNSRAYTVQQLLFGVPQGSVLGPLLYVLYTTELSDVITQHWFVFPSVCQ